VPQFVHEVTGQLEAAVLGKSPRAVIDLLNDDSGFIGVSHDLPHVNPGADDVSVRSPPPVPFGLAPSVEVNDNRPPPPAHRRKRAEGGARRTSNPMNRSGVAVGLGVPLGGRGDDHLTERADPNGETIPFELGDGGPSLGVYEIAPTVREPERTLPLGVSLTTTGARAPLAPMEPDREAPVGRRDPPEPDFRTAPGSIVAPSRKGRTRGGYRNFRYRGRIRG